MHANHVFKKGSQPNGEKRQTFNDISQEATQMAEKLTGGGTTSLVIIEIQIKTTMAQCLNTMTNTQYR